MERKATTAITTVKQRMHLQEWSKQVTAQQSSGMSVQKWCAENGISTKTYYYQLRKVRENCIEESPAIVPVAIPEHSADIHIERSNLHISLPCDIPTDTLLALVREL